MYFYQHLLAPYATPLNMPSTNMYLLQYHNQSMSIENEFLYLHHKIYRNISNLQRMSSTHETEGT
jgi:hypothetical protein